MPSFNQLTHRISTETPTEICMVGPKDRLFGMIAHDCS